MQRLKIHFVLFNLGILLLVPHFSYAQFSFDLSSLGNTLSIVTSPRNVAPNSTITVSAESYSFDIDRSTVSWFVDNTLYAEGTGLRSITLSVGNVGERIRVKTVVLTDTGALFQATTLIEPASVDLLWGAASYTPPFYKGKALLGVGGPVTVTAIPNIRSSSGLLLEPGELIFTWKQGARTLGSSSGVGRDTITLSGYQFFKNLDVRVEVESVESGVAASNRINIKPITPFVLFYEDHPTAGLRIENAFNNEFMLTDPEVTLLAAPYFFATNNKETGELEFLWELNNSTIENPSDDKSSITLRSTGEGGIASLGVVVQHAQYVLQQASEQLVVDFPNLESTSAF